MSLPASDAKTLILAALETLADPVFQEHGFVRSKGGMRYRRKFPAGGVQLIVLSCLRDARVHPLRLDVYYEMRFDDLLKAVNDLLKRDRLDEVDYIVSDHVLTNQRPGRQNWLFHDEESALRVTGWMVDAVQEQVLPVLDSVRDEQGLRAYARRRLDAGERLSRVSFLAAVVAFVRNGDLQEAKSLVRFHEQSWSEERSFETGISLPLPPHVEIAAALLHDDEP